MIVGKVCPIGRIDPLAVGVCADDRRTVGGAERVLCLTCHERGVMLEPAQGAARCCAAGTAEKYRNEHTRTRPDHDATSR